MGKLKKTLKKILTNLAYGKVKKVVVQTEPNQLLSGKIALITGGSGGIGFAIAKRYVESGCKVILVGTKENKLIDSCNQLGNDKAKYIVLDITETGRIESSVTSALNLFEEKRIDILVNSAGFHGSEAFGNVSEATYDSVLDINLKGMFFMSQAVSNYMKKNHIKGHILNISSASALKPAWTPYEISKWGVKGLTLGLASELIEYGIVVNGLAPGPVATKMIAAETDNLTWPYNPSGRMAAPEEIANWAVYMVSNMGDLIVGDTFYITGGSGTVSIAQ